MQKILQNLSYTLQKLELLHEKYDALKQKEEKFNIFAVLHNTSDERRLHSRFIAAILDPFASHGMSNCFLLEFFKLLKDDMLSESNFKNAIVYPKERDKKENNNIDILIIDKKSKHAVIIENKIYAADSNNEQGGQLERYFDHIHKNESIPKSNIRTYYLTLDGHNPSVESLGRYATLDKINGKCLAYDHIIVQWLDSCLHHVITQPFLRESILQYKKLIQKMTHDDTEIKERILIKDTIATSKETLKATKYLIDNFNHVKWHTIYDFWKEMEALLIEKNYSITSPISTDSIHYLAHYQYNKTEEEGGIVFETTNKYRPFIWHEKDAYLFWGIDKENLPEKYAKRLEELKAKGKIEEFDDYWYNYFEFENGEQLFLKDFSLEETFNLIDPDFRAKTINEIVGQLLSFIEDFLEK